MMAEWIVLFRQAGYAPAELEDATTRLALVGPPRYRSEHLAGLLAQLRSRREREAARAPQAQEGPECRLCGGTGRVSVPWEHSDPRGLWYTQAVLCRCPLGRWFAERLAQRHPLTLDAYEAGNPYWREQLAGHREWVGRLGEAVRAAGELDRLFGRIMASVRARQGHTRKVEGR